MRRFLLLALVLGCDKKCEPPPPTPIDPATTGVILGEVLFEGTVPSEKPVEMGGGAECSAMNRGSAVYHRKIIAKDGKLLNVFVHIKSGLENFNFAVPPSPVVIDQEKCMFSPRISGAQVCQPVELRNSDPTNHNISNEYWNVGLSTKGEKRTQTFHEPRVMLQLKCNVHDWMVGYIGIVKHPFYKVTGEDGTFRFEGVPEGTYAVEAWHESLGVQTATVTLKRGGEEPVKFLFKSP